MDNILKMLMGVLSVSGLIALAIPQSNPAPVVEQSPVPQLPATPTRAPAPAPAPPPSPIDVTSTPDFQIGAPSIDGKPINPDFGMPFGMSAQSQMTNAGEVPSASAGYTPTSFTMPSSNPLVGTDMSGEAPSDQ